MRRTTKFATLILCLTPLLLGGAKQAAAVDEIRGVVSWSKSFRFAQGFGKFVDYVNKTGEGIVKITYVGGPEVVPSREQGQAVRSGFVDLAFTSPAYYLGLVPEGDGIIGRRKTPMEIRENGGLAILQEIWAKKLNARLLGLFEGATQYHLYLAREPKIAPSGLPDLSGFKLRVTGTYRPMVRQMGGTPVSISPREIYSALERGLVHGLGWPQIDFMALRIAKQIKYKVEPAFMYSIVTPIMNLDKWNKLSPEARAFMDKAGEEWERRSYDLSAELVQQEAEEMKAAGIKPFEIKGEAAARYAELPFKTIWDRFEKRLPEQAAALKPKMF